MNIKQELGRRLGTNGQISLNDVDVDVNMIRAIMINEVVPADCAQDFYANHDGDYAKSTTSLFQKANIEINNMHDLLEMGVYITNAVKIPKTAYTVNPDSIAESLPWLEAEMALFEKVNVIMLMGDVAKKMYNMIVRKTTKRNVIPSGATYRIRTNQYFHGDIRVIPSYIMTGGNILIEKSKATMIAEDIAAMAEILALDALKDKRRKLL